MCVYVCVCVCLYDLMWHPFSSNYTIIQIISGILLDQDNDFISIVSDIVQDKITVSV